MLPYLGWEHIGNYLPLDTHIYLADNRADVPVTNTNNKLYKKAMREIFTETSPDKYVEKLETNDDAVEVDETFLNETLLSRYEHVPLTISNVYEVDFGTAAAVVIGGETEGISVAARKLCFERQGGIVNLPMAAGVESLNAATAAAVIMYEVRRQLVQRKNRDSVQTVKPTELTNSC